MKPDNDLTLARVSRLTMLTPDERRAARLRARCRTAMQRRAPIKQQRLGPALLAGVGLIYLSALAHDLLRLRGMF